MSTLLLEPPKSGSSSRAVDVPLRIVRGGNVSRTTAHCNGTPLNGDAILQQVGSRAEQGMTLRVGTVAFKPDVDLRAALISASATTGGAAGTVGDDIELSVDTLEEPPRVKEVTIVVADPITAG
jgi:hypothetical protein